MQSLQCHLVYLSGPHAGSARSFDAARITIGRASSCDFQFDPYADLAVASQHAEILLDEDTFFVHDLGTRGGTYVNGERISARHPLRHEDYLQFGKNGPEVVFRKGMAGPDPQPLPPKAPETGELEFLAGTDQGKIFPIMGDKINRVGRRNDLEVPLDPRGDMVVSGNHCTISNENGQFVLTDTSRNGSFINGAPVDGSAYVNDGDVVTFGEGGPRARFVIHPPRRIYPNLTGEWPRIKGQPVREQVDAKLTRERTDEAQARARAEAAAAAAVAKPLFVDRPTSPDAGATASGDISQQVTPPGGGRSVDDAVLRSALLEAALQPDATPGIAGAALREPTPPATKSIAPKASLLAPLKARATGAWGKVHKNRNLLGAAAFGVVALIGGIWLLTREPQKRAPIRPSVAADTALQSLKMGETLTNDAGHFSVQIPNDWTRRQDQTFLSIESPDKQVSVDYLRDNRVSESFVYGIMSQNGASVKKLGEVKSGDIKINSYVGNAPGRSYYAVVHHPPQDVPALALLEASPELFDQIPEKSIAALTADNLKLQQLAPKPTATPKPSPTPAKRVARATQPPKPSPTAARTPRQVAAAVTPAPSPAPEATPQAPPPAPAEPGIVLGRQALGTDITLPAGWTGDEDAQEKVVELKSAKGVDVRIARDPEKMDPAAVLETMVGDGWRKVQAGFKNPVGTTGLLYHAIVMNQDEKHLLLVLLEQPDNSTVVIYATRDQQFTAEQRGEVAQVVREIAEKTRGQ